MSLIRTNLPKWPVMSDPFDNDWFMNRFVTPDWAPAINVVDNESSYEIEVAAPGIKKEDFNVAVNNGMLNISGKGEKEEEEKTKNYARKEFSSQSFTKTFTLPDNVDEDSIQARYEDGVLRINLKKTKKELPPKKEVAIQ
ncbi:MAG: Hsp20/alpha crystallin family protein [Saprospiraceae bacterium]|nr:Hsp20/alpha crystallin family protein [Saprospiraceae bacterium]